MIATNLDSIHFSAYAAGLHFHLGETGSFIATVRTTGHITSIP